MLILELGYAIIAVGKRILACQLLHANENPKVNAKDLGVFYSYFGTSLQSRLVTYVEQSVKPFAYVVGSYFCRNRR
jgi:hypothetical protein